MRSFIPSKFFVSLEGIEENFVAEFGPESSKIRAKKTVSLVNAKFSEMFTKNTSQISPNGRIQKNAVQKVDHYRGKKACP